MTSAFFNEMRYINLRFTYLLTFYLLVGHYTSDIVCFWKLPQIIVTDRDAIDRRRRLYIYFANIAVLCDNALVPCRYFSRSWRTRTSRRSRSTRCSLCCAISAERSAWYSAAPYSLSANSRTFCSSSLPTGSKSANPRPSRTSAWRKN